MSSKARLLLALVTVAAVAAGLRLYHLGQPPERVFDEAYYSKDGCLYTGRSPQQCAIRNSGERYWVIDRASDRGETSWVHPPLGKWAIAAGIEGEGNTPFGWRISSAAAGTATAVLTAYVAWLLFGSILWTYAAGLLLATESLSFVQSRTSMLDVFLGLWVVLGLTFLLHDRRWIERRSTASHSPGPGAMAVDEAVAMPAPDTPDPAAPSPIWRPWRFAAGAAFGAACATKWSGVTALLAAGILTLLWEITRRRRAGERHPLWATIRLEALGVILAFVLVPLAVYLVSYTRYFVEQSWHPSTFFSMEREAWRFHTGLHYINSAGEPAHPYVSKPWTWLAMLRPVSYYFKSPGAEVLAMGNPLLFWGSIVTIPAVAWAWLRSRDWTAGFITVAILVQYLPWFATASRVQFFFYMTPIVPFLVLAAVYVLRDLVEYRPVGATTRPFMPLAVSYVVVFVALFAFFYPVLTGAHLSYDAWHLRMWMRSWI